MRFTEKLTFTKNTMLQLMLFGTMCIFVKPSVFTVTGRLSRIINAMYCGREIDFH